MFCRVCLLSKIASPRRYNPASTPPRSRCLTPLVGLAPQRGSVLRGLERTALAVERPINRIVGNPAYNPLYHTDTIAVFLWLIVAATGIYLSFFVQFGFDVIYHAVSKMESQLVAHVHILGHPPLLRRTRPLSLA